MAQVYVANMSFSSDAETPAGLDAFYQRITSKLERESSCIVVTAPLSKQALCDKLNGKLKSLIDLLVKADTPNYKALLPTFKAAVWVPGIPPRHEIHQAAIEFEKQDGATGQWRVPAAGESKGYVFVNCEWRTADVIV